MQNLVHEEDLKQLLDVMAIRSNRMAYIGIENLINEIKDVIDNSETFEFRSLNAKKFIDKNKPTFVIKVNPNKIEYFLNKYKDKDIEKYINEISSLVGNEIISESSKIINKFIDGNDELVDLLKEYDTSITDLVLSNIYSIKVGNISDNIIYLQIII